VTQRQNPRISPITVGVEQIIPVVIPVSNKKIHVDSEHMFKRQHCDIKNYVPCHE